MNSTHFVGNLVRDPELRTAANGNKRATFTVAVNEGERGTDNEKTHFVNVTAFGTLGENMAASLVKGQRVLVVGRFDSYSKEVQIDGEDKNLPMLSFIASAVGPDLRWATAKVSKVESSGGSSTNGGNGGGNSTAKPAVQKAAPAAAAGDDDDF
ncbi:single-stranded DNA-binding protein [Nocardioides pakistanensis]